MNISPVHISVRSANVVLLSGPGTGLWALLVLAQIRALSQMAHLDSGGAGGLSQEARVIVSNAVIAADVVLPRVTGHLGAAGLLGHTQTEVHGRCQLVTGQRKAGKENE